LAAVRRGFLPLGDVVAAASESRLGRERSVEDVLKVGENHPESRVGKLLMLEVDEEEE
jgi:hypothetical protein